MVFVAVGVLVGPQVLDGVDLESSSSTVRALAEATLALVLFCDASRVDIPHEHPLVLAIYVTVGLSVFAHGLTAAAFHPIWTMPDTAGRGQSR